VKTVIPAEIKKTLEDLKALLTCDRAPSTAYSIVRAMRRVGFEAALRMIQWVLDGELEEIVIE